jgi:hypothetical protein
MFLAVHKPCENYPLFQTGKKAILSIFLHGTAFTPYTVWVMVLQFVALRPDCIAVEGAGTADSCAAQTA